MNTPDQSDSAAPCQADVSSCVDRMCQKAEQELHSRWEKVASTTVGDLVSEVTAKAKKHPGIAMVIAAALGFFLGRLFRR